MIRKLANCSINFESKGGFKSLVGTDEVFIQFENFEEKIDTDKIQNEIERLQGFLFGIEKKLQNEKFMANAQADIIERERQKQADTVDKIEALKAQLA